MSSLNTSTVPYIKQKSLIDVSLSPSRQDAPSFRLVVDGAPEWPRRPSPFLNLARVWRPSFPRPPASPWIRKSASCCPRRRRAPPARPDALMTQRRRRPARQTTRKSPARKSSGGARLEMSEAPDRGATSSSACNS